MKKKEKSLASSFLSNKRDLRCNSTRRERDGRRLHLRSMIDLRVSEEETRMVSKGN